MYTSGSIPVGDVLNMIYVYSDVEMADINFMRRVIGDASDAAFVHQEAFSNRTGAGALGIRVTRVF